VALPSSIEPKLIKQHTSDKPIKHDYGMKSLNLEPSKESIYAMSNSQEQREVVDRGQGLEKKGMDSVLGSVFG
jgi:hypothetical protein